MRTRGALSLIFATLCCCGSDPEPDPGDTTLWVTAPVPPVPVGLNLFRAWEHLYRPRIGTRTYMRSTYDRAGGNEGADASHFLRQENSEFNVTFDVAGPGVLLFVRTNHWHGSPWHYVIDGNDLIVTESSTADPLNPVMNSIFMPEAVFPSPLTYTWSTTRGADLNWVPIPFSRSMTLAYSRTHYGTGYYAYQTVPVGDSHYLSGGSESFGSPPEPDVIALLNHAGDDLSSQAARAETSEVTFDLPARERVQVAELSGRRRIVALKLRIPRAQAIELARARIVITWDGLEQPSVDAPLALFFGSGSFYNRAKSEWLVRGLMTNIRFPEGSDEIELATYFPMPFESHARVELVGSTETASNLHFEVRSVPSEELPEWTTHFHATYQDHPDPELGHDLVLLDTTKTEGGSDYCGLFVGTSFIFSDQAVLSTLEGDPRFFFDDSNSPQGYGSGTEEWAGGGDYWGGQNMTLPFAGHPVGAPDDKSAHNDEDKIESAYRILISDAMPFGKNARIQLEHGGLNESKEHYQSVVYWYGRRGACLVQTDSFHVGDEEDERKHHYDSPTASPVQTITSRYELGVDHLDGREIYPESTDTGRYMTGTTEFTVSLSENNVGALLRRKLDYAFPDQRADVFVKNADDPDAPWESAGTWYLSGSNRCVWSFPLGELDPPAPVIQTSNRRFREDEFLIGRTFTEGHRSVRLRLVFRPASQPILPGAPVPDLAWSELRYTVYSYVWPRRRGVAL